MHILRTDLMEHYVSYRCDEQAEDACEWVGRGFGRGGRENVIIRGSEEAGVEQIYRLCGER